MTHVMVLAGGQSDEHDVSLTSARSLLAAVGSSRLRTSLTVIARDGTWLDAPASMAALARGRADAGGAPMAAALPRLAACDVVFPLLHGPFGEDGTVQGLLALMGIPFVGAGVLASALCMDKLMAKDVLRAAGLPQTPYCMVGRAAWRRDPDAALRAATAMPAPWFVKPANLGSSVGITRVAAAAALPEALDRALALDRRAIVEQGVTRPRELEVAVLGDAGAADASPVGEITYTSEFYDYETKYTAGRAALHIPAAIPDALAAQARALALHAFALVDGAGLARIDFLWGEREGLLLNEINTMPGFTPLSMYPKLWEAGGIPYPELVERLVALALQRG